MASAARDRWAEWLAERRFGGDPAVRAEMLERLTRVRDQVLDGAGLTGGETPRETRTHLRCARRWSRS